MADPIDDYLHSPGATGDPVVAARMFAWCAARYDFAAWIEGHKPGSTVRRVSRFSDSGRGARAAGAYGLLTARPQPDGRAGAVQEGQPRNFTDYLEKLEAMSDEESNEIDLQLIGDPQEVARALRQLDGELARCYDLAMGFQILAVGHMTPEQIAEGKQRRPDPVVKAAP